MMLSSTAAGRFVCKRRIPEVNEKGFTLIELLVTVTVLSFGLLGLAGLQAQMISSNAFSRDITIATSIGEDLIEQSIASGYNGLPSNDWKDTPSYTFLDLDGDGAADDDPYGGRFTVTRTGTVYSSFKEVVITVSWTDAAGSTHTVKLDTNVGKI